MRRGLWVAIVVGALLFLAAACLPWLLPVGWDAWGMGPTTWGHMGGWGMMGMMFVWPVLLLVVLGVVVAGAAWIAQSSTRGGAGAAPAGEAPLDILKRRYAAGEITREQFDEMRRTLGA